MYDHILVPISFDEERDTKGALAVAERLASTEAEITVLHVIEEVPTYVATYMPEGYRADALKHVEARVKAFADGHHMARGVVVEGHSGRTILDYARGKNVDCIVIASHRPGMQDMLLGSTATHVVRHAHCAVHVLR